MYVACRELKLQDGRTVKAGDPVPEAETWRDTVLKAHLNLKWLKRAEGKPLPLVKSPVQVSTSVITGKNQKNKGR